MIAFIFFGVIINNNVAIVLVQINNTLRKERRDGFDEENARECAFIPHQFRCL